MTITLHQPWVLTEGALAIQGAGEGSQALAPAGGYCFVEPWPGAVCAANGQQCWYPHKCVSYSLAWQ